MESLIKKLFNRETISYLFFGVLTTLVDWIAFWVTLQLGIYYLVGTAISWALSVAFAFITNKLFVFRSFRFGLGILKKEVVPFVSCRAVTLVISLVVMKVLVEGLGIPSEFICKVIVSAISLVLNYVFSKWLIFKKEIAVEE